LACQLAVMTRLRSTGTNRLLVAAALAWPALWDHRAGEPLPIGRFRSEPAGYTAYSGIDDSMRVVIADATNWRLYWERVHARVRPVPALPAVDFARDMVILAALGTRRSGGYGVRVDSAYDAGEFVDVVVWRSAPGAGCLVTAAFTQPVDVVRIPSRKVPVRFRERATIEPCN
jgi:hypothetical protein